MSVTAIHLLAHGRVQGIGYRSWAEKKARELNVNGWIRNLPDSTVELVVCGEAAAVARMHQECERGPMAAHVTRLDVNIWTGETPVGFKQLETPDDSEARTA